MSWVTPEALLTEEIEAKAIDELYAARDRGENMHEAGRSVARVVAPLVVRKALQDLTIGLDPLSGLITVGNLRDMAKEIS